MCMGSIAGGQGQSYGWMWVVTRLGRAVIFMRAFTRTLVHEIRVFALFQLDDLYGRTDGRTDKASYRVTSPRLKIRNI